MGKPKRFNSYDKDVAENRRIIENYGRIRQEKSVGSSFRNIPQHPQTSQVSSSAGGGGGTFVFNEVDLGTISGSVDVDWAAGEKFRCILGGNVTFTFTNSPSVDGEYQQIILEAKQDGTGGRTVTFADTFENGHEPVIALGADVYNVWAFYGSGRAGAPIFSFNTYQIAAFTYALSDEYSGLQPSSDMAAITFRIPFGMILTEARGSLTQAAASGNTIIDIKKNGSSVLSSNITINSGDTTSVGGGGSTISDDSLGDNDQITIFLTSAGDAATGAKCTMIGYIS